MGMRYGSTTRPGRPKVNGDRRLAMAVLRLRKVPPTLRLYEPAPDRPPDLGVADWLIDGHPVEVHLWSAVAFAALLDPPTEAIRFPSGVYGLLRVV
jgi:hypothetical protein